MDSEKNFEPKISVVIPMYNTEKFVGECLYSLLIQTFQDFEIIVVDDCSTDKSPEIVESYMPKFNGRLKMIRTEKNSGGCSVPRNAGMKIAKGKYLFLPDSDDVVIKTGLAELYDFAEKFDADVLHCEKFYVSESEKLEGAVLKMQSYQTGKFVREPFLEPHDLEKKVRDLHELRYIWNVWTKFFKREFMEKNNLKFPETNNNEDVIFTIFCVCCAERYVRVPSVVNIYRRRIGSITRTKLGAFEHTKLWFKALAKGFSLCDKFLKGMEFFQKNPEMRYYVLDIVAQNIFVHIARSYERIPAVKFEQDFCKAMESAENPSAIAAFFFSMSYMYSKQIGDYLLEQQRQDTKNNAVPFFD